jgi:NAD(P)-dependent dehydrogenase (short-subunit alcohol dehydrogenase family)
MLEGKVLIITGAAGGIGRACAELAGEMGARLVLNDYGGTLAGENSGDSAPVVETARALKDMGFEVAANAESVADAGAVARMVEQALDTFGGLHGVINPAGILRDGMFHKMSPEAWSAVIDTHLNGAFNIARASIEHFRQQGEGSYVFFSSAAGLIGNIGQANYAAAKMGVVGLSRVVAMEGAAKNIRSNVIAPVAWTRMIASIPVKDEETAARMDAMRRMVRADQVAQLALGLIASDVTGQVFSVRGNEVAVFSQPRPIRTIARVEGWTPQSLIDQGFPFLAADFAGMESGADAFPYDPV